MRSFYVDLCRSWYLLLLIPEVGSMVLMALVEYPDSQFALQSHHTFSEDLNGRLEASGLEPAVEVDGPEAVAL